MNVMETWPMNGVKLRGYIRTSSILITLWLGGCAQNLFYTQPSGLTPQIAATITGSKTVNPVVGVESLQVYLTDIDGQNVTSGPWYDLKSYKLNLRQPWQGTYLLTPGQHEITVGVQCCTESEFNFVKISMNFVAGTTYVLEAVASESRGENALNTNVVVDDKTGKALSAHFPVTIAVQQMFDPTSQIPIFVK